MSTRGLDVFQHDSELGNAHAHALFDRIAVRKTVEVPRDFADYEVSIDESGLSPAVKLLRRLG